jgi:hypothetical protein
MTYTSGWGSPCEYTVSRTLKSDQKGKIRRPKLMKSAKMGKNPPKMEKGPPSNKAKLALLHFSHRLDPPPPSHTSLPLVTFLAHNRLVHVACHISTRDRSKSCSSSYCCPRPNHAPHHTAAHLIPNLNRTPRNSRARFKHDLGGILGWSL